MSFGRRTLPWLRSAVSLGTWWNKTGGSAVFFDNYGVYRALAVAAGNLAKGHRADLTNTAPTDLIGPYPQWADAERIVSIDPEPRAAIDNICDEVIRAGLETCDLSIFDQLEAGDILFLGAAGKMGPTLARMAQPTRDAGFVDFSSFDEGYHESWDIESTMHPQTMVAIAKDGQPLSPRYGAPARVHSPVKLGYKNTKYLTRITFMPKAVQSLATRVPMRP